MYLSKQKRRWRIASIFFAIKDSLRILWHSTRITFFLSWFLSLSMIHRNFSRNEYKFPLLFTFFFLLLLLLLLLKFFIFPRMFPNRFKIILRAHGNENFDESIFRAFPRFFNNTLGFFSTIKLFQDYCKWHFQVRGEPWKLSKFHCFPYSSPRDSSGVFDVLWGMDWIPIGFQEIISHHSYSGLPFDSCVVSRFSGVSLAFLKNVYWILIGRLLRVFPEIT